MVICPLESTVVFGDCQVATCMWNDKMGKCKAASRNNDTFNKDVSERTTEETLAVKNVQDYVSVGTFLEASSGKDIHALREKDFPSREAFLAWAKRKGLSKTSSTNVPYDTIVENIKAAL